MTEQELVEALRACAKSDDPDCRSCPVASMMSRFDGGKSCVDMLLEHAADAIEALEADRDTWKCRAEAAECAVDEQHPTHVVAKRCGECTLRGTTLCNDAQCEAGRHIRIMTPVIMVNGRRVLP